LRKDVLRERIEDFPDLVVTDGLVQLAEKSGSMIRTRIDPEF
jgi:hypothetical protein